MKIGTTERVVTPLKLLPESFVEESIKIQGLGLALECLSRAFRFLRESLTLGHLGDAELQENAKEALDYFPSLLEVLAEYCQDRKDCLDGYIEDLREHIKALSKKASPQKVSEEAESEKTKHR